MAHPWINRELYEAILHFEESDAAQEYYYRIIRCLTLIATVFKGEDGKVRTVRINRNADVNSKAFKESPTQITYY